MALIELREAGLYCPAGRFHIDPWKPVPQALITHGHGDHACPGNAHVVAAESGLDILRKRLPETDLRGVEYGEELTFRGVKVSFHPAGHVLGSAQIRVEHGGEVWVVSGDYKRAPDPTCVPFETVECDVLITEATFALPIYRWREPRLVAAEIAQWWRDNAAVDRASVLYAYILGKSQRILAELVRIADLPERVVYTHGATEKMVEIYRRAGVTMLDTKLVADETKKTKWKGRLVLAPPSVRRSPWVRRFGKHETAFASGWMQVRGTRRGRGLSRGFVLSDHADWPSLLRTIDESGAKRVLCTHGFADPLARYLREQGVDASALETRFDGEDGAESAESESAEEGET